MRMNTLVVSLIASLLVFPTALVSQTRAMDGDRNGRLCAIALEIVRTGDSRAYTRAVTGYPDEYKQAWAYSRIRTCGAAGAAALATRIQAEGSSRDLARLEMITAPTRELRDGSLFEAAVRLARDGGASSEARVFAFRTLMWALEPRLTLEYGGLITDRCVGGYTLHLDTWDGTPLPENRRSRIREVAERTFSLQATPAAVRKAAACALREVQYPDRARADSVRSGRPR